MSREARASVTFSCQRCLQPLRLSGELRALGEHALAELRLPARVETARDERDLTAQLLDHYVAPYRLAGDANGFTLVSDDGDADRPGERLAAEAELFDALSDNSDVDHPLCDECTDSLLQLMDERLESAEAERRDYDEYLRKIESERDELRSETLEAELEDRGHEERRLLDELSALREEEAELRRAVEREERERERLADEQSVYLREYARYRKDLMVCEDRAKCYESGLAHAQSQLERLKKTDAFRAAFHVSDSGRFGIINNFRLGRLPDAPVDWSEINAAWGQAVLLLSGLARKVGFEFRRYTLVPYGNRSYVESIEDRKELPLYGSGGFKLLWDTKFDEAMVAFLDCLQQFKEMAERTDPEFNLPYKMSRGKIEDPATGNGYSVKIQFNSEEQWTKALKYTLTNLKWGLTWISSQFDDDDDCDNDSAKKLQCGENLLQ